MSMTECYQAYQLSSTHPVNISLNPLPHCNNEITLNFTKSNVLRADLYIIQLLWLFTGFKRSSCKTTYIDVKIGLNFAKMFCSDTTPFPLYSYNSPIIVTQHGIEADINMSVRLVHTENYKKATLNTYCREEIHSNRTGVITSPNYPYGYQPGTCLYKIKVGTQQQINMSIMDFMLISSGLICSQRDDNIRIRVAGNINTKFEYATDIDLQEQFYCDNMAKHSKINIQGYEYLFIQFNALRPTAVHRGFAFGYSIVDYSGAFLMTSSSSSGIIIGTVGSISVVLFISILATLFIAKSKKKSSTSSESITTKTNIPINKTTDPPTSKISRDVSVQENGSDTLSLDITGGNEDICANNLKLLQELYASNIKK